VIWSDAPTATKGRVFKSRLPVIDCRVKLLWARLRPKLPNRHILQTSSHGQTNFNKFILVTHQNGMI
jgi:hypothetical protein